ncbi:MAG: cellulose binding domain-containing protein, partial [Eubacterium sp.]|nr:cellulose binding domain-containing protein [Eubacterium sp.]
MKKITAVLLSLSMIVGGTNITTFAQSNSSDINNISDSQGNVVQISDNWDGVTTENAVSGDGFRVTYKLQSSWHGGYNASVKIDNTSNKVIENWTLGFEYQGGITNVWNGVLESAEQGKYIVKNDGWNQDIAVGQSVEFGINGEGDFAGFPSNYQLLGQISNVDTTDYSIDYEVTSDWGTGFNSNLSINNKKTNGFADWVLEFDFDGNIDEIWNAKIESHEGNHYVIKNVEYNSTISANGTVSFGFSVKNGNSENSPKNYHLYSYKDRDNKKIDLNLDTDKDGAPDYIEEYFKTDVRKADTDGDGLSDFAELYALELDPLSKDTDKNGVDDGAEDLDGDGLTNITEFNIGTKIYSTDTDEDGLTDEEEYNKYNTEP